MCCGRARNGVATRPRGFRGRCSRHARAVGGPASGSCCCRPSRPRPGCAPPLPGGLCVFSLRGSVCNCCPMNALRVSSARAAWGGALAIRRRSSPPRAHDAPGRAHNSRSRCATAPVAQAGQRRARSRAPTPRGAVPKRQHLHLTWLNLELCSPSVGPHNYPSTRCPCEPLPRRARPHPPASRGWTNQQRGCRLRTRLARDWHEQRAGGSGGLFPSRHVATLRVRQFAAGRRVTECGQRHVFRVERVRILLVVCECRGRVPGARHEPPAASRADSSHKRSTWTPGRSRRPPSRARAPWEERSATAPFCDG